MSVLKSQLTERGMSAHGTKAELITKLALRQLKAEAFAAGQFDMNVLTVPQLRELKTSLGVKGTATNKAGLVALIANCLE